MDLSGLSIIELKQLLARVNHDLKLNKPTIKRIKQEKKPVLSEGAECNIIAQRFTGNKALPIVHNKKLIQDIAIQKDILDYLNNGNHIITAKSRKSKKFNSVLSYTNNKIIRL
jgi:predicted transcriptional regulator